MVQGELFREDVSQAQVLSASEKSFFSRYQVVFSLDKLLIGVICIVVSFALSYSLGMERGKHYAESRIHMILPAQETAPAATVESHEPNSAADASKTSGGDTIVLVPEAPNAAEAESQTPAPETESVNPSLTSQETTVPSAVSQSPAPAFPLVDLGRRSEFTIQLVTYNREHTASKEIQRLQTGGLQGFVIPSGSFYQVCVNYFKNESEAKSFLKRFRMSGRYPDAFIRPVAR